MRLSFQILFSVLLSYALLQVYPVMASSDGGRVVIEEVKTPDEGPNRPKWFIDLGYIDGNWFYLDLDENRDWYAAKEHCLMHFMQLSAISTENQLNTLIDALEEYGPLRLWTSARESRQSSMFLFDSTGRQPNPSVIPDWRHNRADLPYHYCGYFYANGRNNSRFWTETCDYSIGINTLCFI